MIITRRSSRAFQSMMNDETLCDDLTTLNQNSSSSILYRTLNVQYLSQKYFIRKENSFSLIQTESMVDATKNEPERSKLLENYPQLTPRKNAIIEMITSEQRFVHDMKNILKTYITPMLERDILSSSHIDALFLNWPSLTRTHEKLANELLTADGEQISIGQTLCDFIPQLLTEYEVYFRFHPTAMKCFREQLQTSSKFHAFMEKTKAQTYGIGTMGDANILTLPLQRIAKYPFMIYQIIKNTRDTSPDLQALHDSLKKANELRETINNAIDEEINRVKFEWLQNHVDCTKINEAIVFDSITHFGDQRKLIHYNHIQSKNHRLYAMLFNDFFLLTRIKRPLITKIFQILNRSIFHHRRMILQPSIVRSNPDWFDAPEADHIYLIVHKKPIMLHDIRNLRINGTDSTAFEFDYRGREMNFRTNDVNERILWMKNINEAIEICRRRRLIISMLRAPKSNFQAMVSQSIGEVFIGEINAMNLPFTSTQKHDNSPYCIIEMNHCQRQTTPVLSETRNFQWNVAFRFWVGDIREDWIKCLVYNRSKYTTDRLLGSVEIRLNSLADRGNEQEDSSSIYSSGTSRFSDISIKNWKRRTFYLEHSCNNSQISLKYHLHLNE